MHASATRPIPNLLSIAGSDPSGGAGLQADLATFAALRCYGMSVVTAVTAQNTRKVAAVHIVPPEFVAHQIDVIFEDIEIAAVKIGMLATAATVAAVAARLKVHRAAFVVLDPVLVATSGDRLSDAAVPAALVEHLFPLATLVTPNLDEAAVLCGATETKSSDFMREAATKLHSAGARAVLVKGGHGTGANSDDLLFDGMSYTFFSAPRVSTRSTHGTGCTLASAIAARLAYGDELAAAISAAKTYVSEALASSEMLRVGRGHGPLGHFHSLWAAAERDQAHSDPDESQL
jgi:hydroxymethylpyrimidine/phosphomethylpyrimidine kinase